MSVESLMGLCELYKGLGGPVGWLRLIHGVSIFIASFAFKLLEMHFYWLLAY